MWYLPEVSAEEHSCIEVPKSVRLNSLHFALSGTGCTWFAPDQQTGQAVRGGAVERRPC
jgi:hypothetical protein